MDGRRAAGGAIMDADWMQIHRADVQYVIMLDHIIAARGALKTTHNFRASEKKKRQG